MRIISGKAKGTKLYTLEGENTRPTLDRIKESLFNIINNSIVDSIVLDLFAGSGSIGLEFVSRGAKKVIMCDSSKQAINIINRNIEKTKLQENIEIYNTTSLNILKKLSDIKFDFIFLDPPYDSKLIAESIEKIYKYNLVSENGIIIIETDQEERIIKELENYKDSIYDIRKYGRVKLIFMRKG